MAYKIYQENKDKSFKEKLLHYVDAKNFKNSEVYSRAKIAKKTILVLK